MTTHELKCWPSFFQAILDDRKRFELRVNDRNYQVGDVLHLREWNPELEQYTGREIRRTNTYQLHIGSTNLVAMSLGASP